MCAFNINWMICAFNYRLYEMYNIYCTDGINIIISSQINDKLISM